MPDSSPIHRELRRSRARLGAVVSRVPDRPHAVLEAGAFWLAVALPAAYLPVVAVPAVGGSEFVPGLLALHALCVVLGSDHTPAA
ncbi:hypothetical protein [Halomicrobium salinisoli]|uniref:hypothetical protein n=1 Tax=Halomicrobium salinisoli TaxID=2878391 RepID=UPI001CF0607F|nr:hypothetical protein [Halomicrobium salinisoli]